MSKENDPQIAARRPRSITLPLRMPEDLDRKVTETAAEIGLSKQDTVRLSLERGLNILVKQLSGDAAA